MGRWEEPIGAKGAMRERKKRYILMDKKFKEAMIRAIKKKLEKPFLGIFRAKESM